MDLCEGRLRGMPQDKYQSKMASPVVSLDQTLSGSVWTTT